MIYDLCVWKDGKHPKLFSEMGMGDIDGQQCGTSVALLL